MLSNIVGTLLAFVTVMLMLSLIVTSLVQFVQATLRLRGRNLLVGVGAFIKKHAPKEHVSHIEKSPLRWDAHTAIAARVLNVADGPAKYLDAPNGTARVLMGPPISWVDPNDLAKALLKTADKHASDDPDREPVSAKVASTAAANATAAAKTPPTLASKAAPKEESEAAIARAFKNMEPAIAKRFQFIIRIWTVAISFLIAFSFQLSTPDLLQQLPAAEAKREAILAAVPSLTSESTKTLAFSQDNILEESLTRLGGKFPDYKSLFEEVSGDGASKQDMMDEMRGVLGKRPDREAVLSAYSAIIDSLSQDSAKTSLANTTRLLEQLDSFGISPKIDNLDFYVGHVSGPTDSNGNSKKRCVPNWNNIIGVLITGILLSLGAPFWFQQLKNLSSLRDAMNPPSATTTKKT